MVPALSHFLAIPPYSIMARTFFRLHPPNFSIKADEALSSLTLSIDFPCASKITSTTTLKMVMKFVTLLLLALTVTLAAPFGPKKNFDLCEEALSQYQKWCSVDLVNACTFNIPHAVQSSGTLPATLKSWCGILRVRISDPRGFCREVHDDCHRKTLATAGVIPMDRQCFDVVAEYLAMNCSSTVTIEPDQTSRALCELVFASRPHKQTHCQLAYKMMVNPEGSCELELAECMMRYRSATQRPISHHIQF
jgi:hypothetical protein